MRIEPETLDNNMDNHSVTYPAVATQQNYWLQNEVNQQEQQQQQPRPQKRHSAKSDQSRRAKSSSREITPIIMQVQPSSNHYNPNCPPGLEYLTAIDQLLVQQKVELIEVITGFETNNKFNVKNTLGQKVYWAAEDNDCCTRNCCGPLRRFNMKVYDIYQNEVMHMRRPAACSSCCFPCCLQSMDISAPPGNHIGRVEQTWSILYPNFLVKNANGDTVLRIKGPFCTYSLCGDVEFKIFTLEGEEIGRISKQWSGLARELFTDADFFGISFPMDLDVNMKAVMLGACFLIDAMFFEKAGNREEDKPGMV